MSLYLRIYAAELIVTYFPRLKVKDSFFMCCHPPVDSAVGMCTLLAVLRKIASENSKHLPVNRGVLYYTSCTQFSVDKGKIEYHYILV